MKRFSAAGIPLLLAGLAAPALAQDRSADNAVTQAEDAFGFSVGRESLGIYSAGNARGFSPTAAGNVRIEGLYFDPAFGLTSIVNSSTSIKVGLSAQGYPFIAPSGVVDLSLRRPADRASASIVLNGDSFGSYGIEVDGSLPLSRTLSLGYGVTGNHTGYPDGTDSLNHGQGLIARWRPAPGVEILPFYTLYNDYDDEAGTLYIPAGRFLPPLPPAHRFDGPGWVGIRYTGTAHGVLSSVVPARNWLLRVGAFRAVADQKAGYSNLLTGLQPDGSGDRLRGIHRRPPAYQRLAERRGAIDPQHRRRTAPPRRPPQPARARRAAPVRRLGAGRPRPGADRRDRHVGEAGLRVRADRARPGAPDHVRRRL